MYNVYVKRIFVIAEIVRMNAGVNSEKEKVKESESQSRSVAPPLDIHFGCRVGGVTYIWWTHVVVLALMNAECLECPL